MAGTVVDLAYDAAKMSLSQQDQTVGNLRNRSTTLFTASALAVSFTAGIGLVSGDGKLPRQFPGWIAITLLAALTAMGSAVLVIHWPVKKFNYGPSARAIRQLHQDGKDYDEIQGIVTAAMIDGIVDNSLAIRSKQLAMRWLVLLLWLELVLILFAVITS